MPEHIVSTLDDCSILDVFIASNLNHTTACIIWAFPMSPAKEHLFKMRLGDKEEWQLTLVLSRAPIAPHDEVVNSFLLQVIFDGRSDVPHDVGIMLNVITEKYQVLSDQVPTVAWIVQHTGVDGDLIISPVC